MIRLPKSVQLGIIAVVGLVFVGTFGGSVVPLSCSPTWQTHTVPRSHVGHDQFALHAPKVPEYGYSTRFSQNLTVYDSPRDRFRDNLRPDKKYITAWGHAGFTNDFMTYMQLVYLATLSERIPILPPVTGSRYVGAPEPPLYLSELFDLERLAREIKHPILEWSQVKNRGSGIVEDLGGWSPRLDKTPEAWAEFDNVVVDFNIAMSWSQTPTWVALTDGSPGGSFWGMVALSYPRGHNSGSSSSQPRVSRLNGRTSEPDQHLFALDYMHYSGAFSSKDGWDTSYAPVWRFVAQYCYFNREVEGIAKRVLRKAFELKWGESIPPFIGLHVRRGDFAAWCPPPATSEECLPSIKAFADRVEEIRHELATRAVNPIFVQNDHVFIASNEVRDSRNEESTAFWNTVTLNGWKSVEWEKEDIDGYDLNQPSAHAISSRYSGIFDAAILSMASGFVGTPLSTFSLVAKLRVETWNDGIAKSVRWGTKDADASHDGSWASASGL